MLSNKAKQISHTASRNTNSGYHEFKSGSIQD